VDCSNRTAETGTSFSLENSILHNKYKPALYIYMLQRIKIPPTPMNPVVMTVKMATGTLMLIPVGPSMLAGSVRLTDPGGTVTFTEARQAAAYAASTGVDPALGSGIFSFLSINRLYMHWWQSRMATTVSFLHKQLSSVPHAWIAENAGAHLASQSVLSCPAGISMVWMAEMFPRLPPTLTVRPSPCWANNAKIATTKRRFMSSKKPARKGLK